MKMQHKQATTAEAQHQVATWQALGREVVFTNGCFDLLHYGHVHYLAEAAALGDYLVVGLNSDASVQRLKGQHRPIQSEQSRAAVLAALACVDLVVVFEDDTPLELIRCLTPDVLVKGGDWAVGDIVGSGHVLGQGGQVYSLDFIEGHSTTSLQKKIILASRNRMP